MIAQRAQQDTQDQVNDSVPREQYEEMRRIANAMVFWLKKVQREGLTPLDTWAFEGDMAQADRLGLDGDR